MKDWLRKLTGGSSKGKKKRRRRRREGESSSKSTPTSPKDEDTRRLQRKLEDNAQTMSIRRLQKYGLQSVRVIDADSIRDIVNTAVDEALRHRGADLSVGEREAVQDHAKARIMELLEENQRLSQEKTDQEKALEEAQAGYQDQRTALQDQLDTLRMELQERQRELQAELAAARQSGGGTTVVEVPVARSATSGSGGGAVEVMQQIIRKEISLSDDSFEAMEDRVTKLLKRMIETGELGRGDELEMSNLEAALKETLARAVADVKEAEGGEGAVRSEKVDMLELRIRKLNNALEEKEVALKKLAQHKGFVDNGLASIYDQIQGLSYEDPDYERKGELLKEVFDQNRELQEFMGFEVKPLGEPLDDAAPGARATPRRDAPPEDDSSPGPPRQADEAPAGAIPSGDGGAGLAVPEGFAKPVEVDFGDVAF